MFFHSSKLADLKTRKFVSTSSDLIQNVMVYEVLTLNLLAPTTVGARINLWVTNVIYTGCNRRKGQNFGRVFLMLKYTDITQNTYIQI